MQLKHFGASEEFFVSEVLVYLYNRIEYTWRLKIKLGYVIDWWPFLYIYHVFISASIKSHKNRNKFFLVVHSDYVLELHLDPE